jgi:hypothetical protein
MMTSDEYVRRIIAKYKVPNEVDALTQCFVVNPLINMIKEWAGDCLNDRSSPLLCVNSFG